MKVVFGLQIRPKDDSETIFLFLVLFFLLAFLNITISIYKASQIIIPPVETVKLTPLSNFDLPILIYHYVEYVSDPKDTIRKSLNIEPFIFEQQVKTLKQANYTFLTPKDIDDIVSGKMRLPKKPVILTFDDGYEDFYTDVLPILKKYKVKAVTYIISGFLDTPNYLTSSQMEKIIKSGLVEVACHTAHHPNLTTLSENDAEKEIDDCHNNLAEKFGIKVVSFAYPYGSYNESLFPLVEKAGFKNAVTTLEGAKVDRTAIFAIPRIRTGNRIGQELIAFLEKENYISLNSVK